jgi:hypothetical protein
MRENVFLSLASPQVVYAEPTEAELVSLLFQSFPDEILLEIFRHIPTSNLLELSSVNRKWLSMCNESVADVQIASWQSYWSELNEAGDDDIVTAKFVRHISSVKKNVTRLSVSCVEAIGENPRAMSIIGSAKKLQFLSFNGIKLPKRAMKALAHCQELRKLSFRSADNWNPANLQMLSKLTNLEILNLKSMSIAPAFRNDPIPLDRHFPSLRQIHIRCWSLSESSFGFLPNLNSSLITSLRLSPCRINDTQAVSISRLTNLSILKLDNASTISAASVNQFLPCLTRLSDLYLQAQVSDAALSNFGKMTNLTSFTISHSNALTGSFFSQCSAAHSNLVTLQLSTCGGLESIDRLSFLTNLTFLDIEKTSHSSEAFMAVLPSLAKLETLNVAESHLSSLPVQKLTSLAKLVANNCLELSHVDPLPSTLSHLNINNCPKLLDLSCLSGLRSVNELLLCGLRSNPLEHLSSLRAAYRCSLSNTVVSAESIRPILDSQCYIGSVELENNPHFDDEMLELMCTNPKVNGFTYLNVNNCPEVTDEAYKFICSAKKLGSLSVGPANDTMLAHIALSPVLRSLTIVQAGTATVDGFIKVCTTTSARIYIQQHGFSTEEKLRLRAAGNITVY